jgi:hypothetical protein
MHIFVILLALTCFWAGVAALVAWLCGFPLWPVTAGMALFVFVYLRWLFSHLQKGNLFYEK